MRSIFALCSLRAAISSATLVPSLGCCFCAYSSSATLSSSMETATSRAMSASPSACSKRASQANGSLRQNQKVHQKRTFLACPFGRNIYPFRSKGTSVSAEITLHFRRKNIAKRHKCDGVSDKKMVRARILPANRAIIYSFLKLMTRFELT